VRLARNRKSEGFTLVELLVAVALLALLTAVLLAGFRFETQASYRQSARLDRADRLPVVFAFLRVHLTDARPVLPINSTGTTIVFDGRRGAVSFVGTAPQGTQRAGLYLFTLSLAQRQLRVGWRLFEGVLPVADTGGDESVLLDDIASAHFSYYGLWEPNADAGWHDLWRGAAVLPAAIRLDLAFADGMHPPALIVQPRLRPLEWPVPPAVPR
jgi:general secretion pathway protein J